MMYVNNQFMALPDKSKTLFRNINTYIIYMYILKIYVKIASLFYYIYYPLFTFIFPVESFTVVNIKQQYQIR